MHIESAQEVNGLGFMREPAEEVGGQVEVRWLTYKAVAAKLCISERTIKYHMGEIIARLHLENRAQVIEYARRSGLVKS